MRFHRKLVLLSTLLLPGATACLPYTVGSTAQTVPVGNTTNATSWYFIPNAVRRPGDTISTPLPGSDEEWRYGLDERSDVGLRLTSGLGVVMNYKHRFADYSAGSPAMAYLVGGGIVNGGLHAHLEASLIASGDERAEVSPFGGLRAMQVVPISHGAVHDSPTLGAFGGAQIGNAGFIIRPELGVFYDRSALGVRSASVIVVPAVTIQRRRRDDDRESRFLSRRPEMAGTRPAPTADRPSLIRCMLLGCSRSSSGDRGRSSGTIIMH